ncbi:MAG TPA: hypothetical protein VHW66_21870 [Stellaceae bacterium]|jgi:hypothetical protein|nr:hypothetical protein [Stellaceae bacterium]
MRAGENVNFKNISATTAPFVLRGGKYGVDVAAAFGGGSVKLQKVLGDGTSLASVSSGTDFTAAGFVTVDLPPGTYQFTIDTATAVYANVQRIPGE